MVSLSYGTGSGIFLSLMRHATGMSLPRPASQMLAAPGARFKSHR